MVTDKKIPLLTQIYQPKFNAELESKPKLADATLITPELIARIAAHIKPRLEADITKTLTESVREALGKDLVKVIQDEILTLQASFEARTFDFVDKTKADLKTDLPRMYQASANTAFNDLSENIESLQTSAISKFDTTLSERMQTAVSTATTQIGLQVEAIQTGTSARIMQDISQQLSAFQAQSLGNHQALLDQEIQQVFESIQQQGKGELQEQLRAMQSEALVQMRAMFNEAIPSIYAAAVDEVKAKFSDEMTAQSVQLRDNFLVTINADLPAVQEVLRDNIQQIMAVSLPSLELDLRNQLTTELQDLLLKVKFVLPK